MWVGGAFRVRIPFEDMGKNLSAFPYVLMLGQDENERIKYRDSPLSRTLAGVAKDAPMAGDRFPWVQLTFHDGGRSEDVFERLDDTRFNLLVIGQAVPSNESLGLGDLLRTHVVPFEGENIRVLGSLSITAPAYYLLRPDGHIGLAGRNVDEGEIRRWFASCRVHLGTADRQMAGVRLGAV
jgi:hypothetical protein